MTLNILKAPLPYKHCNPDEHRVRQVFLRIGDQRISLPLYACVICAMVIAPEAVTPPEEKPK